jgi:hypothetical protein
MPNIHHQLLYLIMFLSTIVLIASFIQIYHVWMDCERRRRRKKIRLEREKQDAIASSHGHHTNYSPRPPC